MNELQQFCVRESNGSNLWDKLRPSSQYSSRPAPCSRRSPWKFPWVCRPPRRDVLMSFVTKGKGDVRHHWDVAAYILRIGLSCVVRASHDQAAQGQPGTVAGLFGFLQHHRYWLRSVKCHLPDPMCGTRGLTGKKTTMSFHYRLPSQQLECETDLRNGVALQAIFLSLPFSFSLWLWCHHVVGHLKGNTGYTIMTTHTWQCTSTI